MPETTTPVTTEPPPPDHHDDEIRIGNWGWWAIGGAFGTAITMFLAFAILMGFNGRPDYARPEPATGSGAAAEAGPTAEIELAAAEFAFDPAAAVVEADFTLGIRNDGVIFHNLEIEGVADFLLEADPGMSASGALTLDPGDYVFFCSVPGHREAGMEGELTVAG